MDGRKISLSNVDFGEEEERVFAVENACRQECRYIDLGASLALPGVRRFKEGFGAEATSYRSVDLAGPERRVARALLNFHRRWR